MSKKIYLVDGYGFLFRAYHVMPPLTNPEGVPVGAVYGFVNMLTKVLNDHQPDYMAVVFDAGSKTFRNEIYSDYKANRPPPPEDLIPQFDLIRDASQALGLKTLEKIGFEADDIIATLAQKGKNEGLEVVIISSDKDLMQLIGEGVVMFDAMKSKIIADKEVEEKFGVPPNKVLDVLSLMGDSSDNVPGVPGIGPKTASDLINEYNNLDELLERAGEIKQNKRRESLIEFAEQARLSRELITLNYEVPIDGDFDNFSVNYECHEGFAEFCEKHNFKSLNSRKIKQVSNNPEPIKKLEAQMKISVVEDEKVFEEFIAKANLKNKFALYFLSDLGAAFALENGECIFVKFGAESTGELFDLGNEKGIPQEQVAKIIQPILANHEVLKVLYNKKSNFAYPEFISGALDETLKQVQGVRNLVCFDDLMVMDYVLNTGLNAEFVLNGFEELIGKGKDKRKAIEIPVEELAEFACKNAHKIMQNHADLKQRLFEKKQLTIYERFEKPLINILAKMEAFGTKLDLPKLQELSKHFEDEIGKLETEIFAHAGREFNIGSPKQLGEVLFEELGLASGKKNKKSGNLSTSAQILSDLAAEGHEIVAKVLDWRQLSKLKSTYTDSLQKEINAKTGRVHTTFLQTSTNTGRLSSQAPNVQNIPIRTEEGRKIRGAFIAEKGNKLISADYSQIELRLLAHVGKIEPLLEAFKNGKDIHAVTAHQVFGVPLDAVDDEHRRKAKTINFGIIYGLSAHGLSQRLKIPRVEAANYIKQYFEQYPGIKKYMDDTIMQCKEQGYVETIFGTEIIY